MKCIAAVAFLIAAVSAEEPSVLESIANCQESHECATIQPNSKHLADNAFCGSLPTFQPDYTKDIFAGYCVRGDSCFATDGATAAAPTVVKTIKDVDSEIAALSAAVQKKIGNGLRRKMMNPEQYGTWACQSWAQLTDLNNTPVFGGVSHFLYNKATNECQLLSEAPSSTGEAAGSINGVVGRVDCNALEQNFNFESLSQELVDECNKTPSSVNCRKIDTLDREFAPGYCSTFLSKPCVQSEEIVSKCFNEFQAGSLPTEKTTVGSSAAEVKEFLAEAGETFWTFAGRVGFTEHDSNMGELTKKYVPAVAGATACRNIALLSNQGKRPTDAEVWAFDEATEECHFMTEEAWNKANSGKTDADVVSGPAFCL